MSKQWSEYTKSEQQQGYVVLVTVALFILFWIASDFLSALGLILVGYALYFIYRAVRYDGARTKNVIAALTLLIFGSFVMPEATQTSSVTPLASEQSATDHTAVELAETAKLEAERKAKAIKEAEAKRVKAKADRERKEENAQQLQLTGDLYRVTGITDGDTIKVSINGTIETVRFIGMDTPETKDPRKPVQCFGREASSRMQSYVQSKHVRLEADSTQGERDKYGRLLRYVYAEDGRNIAYEMIKAGYAHEYTYNLPYKYQAQFKAAYALAKNASAGLWSPNTCGGVTNQEHPPAPVVRPQPAPVPVAPSSPSQSSVYYKNCTAARAAGAAPVYAGQPGYGTHLDRDRDGIGCE